MVVYSLCIVEDDEMCACALKSMIEKSPFADSLSLSTFDGRPALEGYLAAGGNVDVLVTDINLGSDGADGIELVRELFPEGTKTQVIYVTGYIEYCTPVYETKHTYFIAKPVKQSYLNDALKKSLENLSADAAYAPEPSEASEARPQSPSIVLKVRGRSIVVACDDIDFVESERRKARFHTADGPIESYCALADAAESLPDTFFQCHKSFIVNMDKVVEIGKDGILMKSGAVVPVSQKRRRLAKEVLLEHLKARA